MLWKNLAVVQNCLLFQQMLILSSREHSKKKSGNRNTGSSYYHTRDQWCGQDWIIARLGGGGGFTSGFWDRIPLGKAIEGVRGPDSACWVPMKLYCNIFLFSLSFAKCTLNSAHKYGDNIVFGKKFRTFWKPTMLHRVQNIFSSFPCFFRFCLIFL